MDVPGWWQALLLGLAAFRVYRLIAEDTILDQPRRYLLRLGSDWQKDGDPVPDNYRAKWAEFITCPWCAGFWISGILLLVYYEVVFDDSWSKVFGFIVTWLAISAFVGLVAKNLDAED